MSTAKHNGKRISGAFLMLLAIFCFNIQASQVYAADSLGIRTVIIDPGHGGKDPGCLGKYSHEADVALAISLKLGKMIKTYYGNDIQVIYTRTEDKFVELAERARIANRNNGDLFICIHANASANTASKGTETYFLGMHKAEAQLKVAERENNVILVEDDYKSGYQNYDPKDPDSYIYIVMKASLYMEQSGAFAEAIQKYVANTPNVTDRGVKQAGFLVLHQVNMPSVLIETGFLTNAEEEKVLNSETDQYNIAKAIFMGFVDYKKMVDTKNGVKDKDRGNPEDVLAGRKTEIKEVKVDTTKVVKDPVVDNTNDKNGGNQTNPNAQSTYKGPSSQYPFAEDKVIFKVQIQTSTKKMECTPANFKGLSGVEYYVSNGVYKFTYGKSNNFEEAKKWETEAREKGFKEAFVIAFLKGERIDIQTAKQMANK
jgi:N-acetylmuramoyl-L-alanine amidase